MGVAFNRATKPYIGRNIFSSPRTCEFITKPDIGLGEHEGILIGVNLTHSDIRPTIPTGPKFSIRPEGPSTRGGPRRRNVTDRRRISSSSGSSARCRMSDEVRPSAQTFRGGRHLRHRRRRAPNICRRGSTRHRPHLESRVQKHTHPHCHKRITTNTNTQPS